MNRMDRIFGASDEARLRYAHMEFQVVLPGDYVRCAVTGNRIPLTELRYWNVDRQEAYSSAAVAFQRYRELRAGRK
jgi:hypothetical protein